VPSDGARQRTPDVERENLLCNGRRLHVGCSLLSLLSCQVMLSHELRSPRRFSRTRGISTTATCLSYLRPIRARPTPRRVQRSSGILHLHGESPLDHSRRQLVNSIGLGDHLGTHRPNRYRSDRGRKVLGTAICPIGGLRRRRARREQQALIPMVSRGANGPHALVTSSLRTVGTVACLFQ